MVAKGGARLLEKEAAKTLISKLLPLATVVTPNATEAEAISGKPIRSIEDAKAAAKEIAGMGPKAVIVKGGHLPGEKAIDILFYEGVFQLFEAERVETTATHGTGCTFSSAIAAELAKGTEMVDAIGVAKAFINTSIRFGLPIGHGHGPVNPMANLYNEAAKYRVLKQVKTAVEILEAHHEVSTLIPESQTNIVMALPQAVDPLDVAGVRGRIVRVGQQVKASACPEFGASSHVARTVLAAMKHEQAIKAGMNIRYSENLIAVCTRLGFTVSSYDRKEEPVEIKQIEGRTTRWGAEQAITKIGRVPQVIYHTGDWGKEPMIILLGTNAPEVAEMAVKIAGKDSEKLRRTL
jgi:hydroxymethylpyrimidine/phosphomethylpyrimidine kinase